MIFDIENKNGLNGSAFVAKWSVVLATYDVVDDAATPKIVQLTLTVQAGNERAESSYLMRLAKANTLLAALEAP